MYTGMEFGGQGHMEQHGFAKNRIWKIDVNPPPLQETNRYRVFVDLILKPSEEDSKNFPHRYVHSL